MKIATKKKTSKKGRAKNLPVARPPALPKDEPDEIVVVDRAKEDYYLPPDAEPDFTEPALPDSKPPKRPKFSAEDIAHYERLCRQWDDGEYATYSAAREIYESRVTDKLLYLIPRDDAGKPLYPTFSAWLDGFRGKDWSWFCKGMNWLRLTDAERDLGLGIGIGLKAAQAFAAWKTPEDWQAVGGLKSVLEEAAAEGLDRAGRISYESAMSVCSRRTAYYLYEPDKKPAAGTYGAYCADFKRVAEFRVKYPQVGEGVESIYTEARKRGKGYVAGHLVKVAEEQKQLPTLDRLVLHFTGEQLEDILKGLERVARKMKPVTDVRLKLSKAQEDAAAAAKKLAEAQSEAKAAGVESESKPDSDKNSVVGIIDQATILLSNLGGNKKHAREWKYGAEKIRKAMTRHLEVAGEVVEKLEKPPKE